MILPTLSINGTSKNELWLAANAAQNKLDTALTALRKTHPHPRDYPYATPGVFETAMAEYLARIASVEAVIADLETFLKHTD